MNDTSEYQHNTNIPKGERRLLQSFRILIVIPTLGERLDTLCRTLSSIHDQSEVLVDTILVTKTKSVELSAVADRYSTLIIYHPGKISAAINAGFAQATKEHKYVGWIGDDDMLRSGSLSIASSLLECNPTAVVSYGTCDYIDYNGNILFNRRPPPNAPLMLQFIPGLIKQETCLFRLSALQLVGGLNEELKYTMDLDLLLRLRRLGPFAKADKVLAAFCWHPGSITISNRKASLLEAQDVQRSRSRGIARMLQFLSKYPVRFLFLTMSWKINRDLKQSNISEIRSVRN